MSGIKLFFKSHFFRGLLAAALVAIAAAGAGAQNVKRVVIIKVDGLPGYYVDRFVNKRDPQTGKSVLPWFDEIFYKNGTRVPNFYSRGLSLSAQSWGQLDTGLHLQIKGNVEYDRYTQKSYDYLNFFPFYVQYGLGKKADMPAVEVMDQLGIPLLFDAFPYEKRYISHQLFQRGNEWGVLANGFVKLFPREPNEFIDEWTMGFEFSKTTIKQNERDIINRLINKPEVDYLDYYDFYFDHVSHGNNDTESRFIALKALDGVIGKIWVAIQSSSRAAETAMIVVSDHGMNCDEGVTSQGFNLIKVLAGAAGGGHHVATKRRHMQDYTIMGLYPLIPLIKASSNESYYLKGQSGDYSTALVDFDGNERSSIHLRNSDLNMLHILLQQLQRGRLSPEVRFAATRSFFDIIDGHRAEWEKNLGEMGEELDALHRWVDSQQKIIAARPKTFTPAEYAGGVDKQARRVFAQAEIAVAAEADYRKYLSTVTNLLALKSETFDARRVKIEDIIAPGAMGEANTVYQLQNYVAGPSPAGLTLDQDNELDVAKSFVHINYFDLLHSQRVRNNVQRSVSSRPVDFVAVRVPAASVSAALPDNLYVSEDPIWLFGAADKQALILSRTDRDGAQSFYYLPVANLRQSPDGKVTFQLREWGDGLPLKYYEDALFSVPRAERSRWLSNWHTDLEWLTAVHKTTYSNAIIGLNEQLTRKPIFEGQDGEMAIDERLMRRLRKRQRQLVEPDLLILAANHWNFDIKGFNPGGNHGSFFRVSTNSAFMIAGGDKTGIPRALTVEQPYDSLSFVPTVMRLMGKIDAGNEPSAELRERGFRKFPGRVITELSGSGIDPGASK